MTKAIINMNSGAQIKITEAQFNSVVNYLIDPLRPKKFILLKYEDKKRVIINISEISFVHEME